MSATAIAPEHEMQEEGLESLNPAISSSSSSRARVYFPWIWCNTPFTRWRQRPGLPVGAHPLRMGNTCILEYSTRCAVKCTKSPVVPSKSLPGPFYLQFPPTQYSKAKHNTVQYSINSTVQYQ